jgi:hypothetical protein
MVSQFFFLKGGQFFLEWFPLLTSALPRETLHPRPRPRPHGRERARAREEKIYVEREREREREEEERERASERASEKKREGAEREGDFFCKLFFTFFFENLSSFLVSSWFWDWKKKNRKKSRVFYSFFSSKKKEKNTRSAKQHSIMTLISGPARVPRETPRGPTSGAGGGEEDEEEREKKSPLRGSLQLDRPALGRRRPLEIVVRGVPGVC